MKQEKHKFSLQEQVIVRRPLLHGRGGNLIKVGTITAFAPGGEKAIVSFPQDNTRTEIPLGQLEPASQKFSRARVQVDPLRRAIGSLR